MKNKTTAVYLVVLVIIAAVCIGYYLYTQNLSEIGEAIASPAIPVQQCSQLGVEPTDLEQYALELINRARANPVNETHKYGFDLNEALPPGKISPDPKPPLAFQLCLVNSARKHTQWQFDVNTIDIIGIGNSLPVQRAADAGYNLLAGQNVIENVGSGNMWADSPDWVIATEGVHSGLLWDFRHRVPLMNPDWVEIGIGVATGRLEFNPGDPGSMMSAIILSQDFTGTPIWGHSITGVVYNDLDGNEFYTPGKCSGRYYTKDNLCEGEWIKGEGIGNVTITATNSTGGKYNTTTWSSGGYTLPLPAGNYSVKASKSGMNSMVVRIEMNSTQNLKLDFVQGNSGETHVPQINLSLSSHNIEYRKDSLTITWKVKDIDLVEKRIIVKSPKGKTIVNSINDAVPIVLTSKQLADLGQYNVSVYGLDSIELDNKVLDSFTVADTITKADIKANNNDMPIDVLSSENVTISYSLNVSDYLKSTSVEWWILEKKSNPKEIWYYYSPASKKFVSGMKPSYQMTYANALTKKVASGVVYNKNLSAGNYTFYFGIDKNLNNAVDLNNMFYDEINVNVGDRG